MVKQLHNNTILLQSLGLNYERERVKSLRDFDFPPEADQPLAEEFYLPRSERETFYYRGNFNNLKCCFYSAFFDFATPLES